jgi:predicted dienelactone hydrolase
MVTDTRVLRDESRRDFRDPGAPRPVRTHLWAPPDDDGRRPLPVVLVSHGTGGSAAAMAWLARALAGAGFLAVAVDHHGNTAAESYLPEGFAFVWERPRDLSFVLDVLARERPLGPVGAAGFSLGGYTAAALLGARLDEAVLRSVVAGGGVAASVPEFPDWAERLREAVPAAQLARRIAEGAGDHADPRVRAAFLVCPMGALVTPASLAAVDRPLEVRWGGADDIAPPGENALRYLRHAPGAAGRSAGEKVRHYDFLDHDPDGGPARARVAADAVAFFRERLADAPA